MRPFILWFAPRWVIATGGYVSAPIILATLILRMLRLSPTRVFLHEQNSIPGQLNALLGRWVDRVLLTFPQTLSFFPKNGVLVGYPIRQSIALKPREEALAHLPFQVPPGTPGGVRVRRFSGSPHHQSVVGRRLAPPDCPPGSLVYHPRHGSCQIYMSTMPPPIRKGGWKRPFQQEQKALLGDFLLPAGLFS